MCFFILIGVCLLLGTNVEEEEDATENCEKGELDR